jgi:hypothetical protein
LAETETNGRPRCEVCGVAKWLARIVSGGGADRYVFECQVCGAQTILSLDDPIVRSLEGHP